MDKLIVAGREDGGAEMLQSFAPPHAPCHGHVLALVAKPCRWLE
jgi:hypothetical protein